MPQNLGNARAGIGAGVAVLLIIVIAAVIAFLAISSGVGGFGEGTQTTTTTYSTDGAPLAQVTASLVINSDGTTILTGSVKNIDTQSFGAAGLMFDGLDTGSFSLT
ncbi:MAG: hypothetical protein JRN09_09655 [Nitrososphaerota archaeon]|nr:hypothetical protein [Nitrososphaerota archaeon]